MSTLYIIFFYIYADLDTLGLSFPLSRLSRPGQQSSPSPTSPQSWHWLVHIPPLPFSRQYTSCNASISIYAICVAHLLHCCFDRQPSISPSPQTTSTRRHGDSSSNRTGTAASSPGRLFFWFLVFILFLCVFTDSLRLLVEMPVTGAAAEVDWQGLEMCRRDASRAPWYFFFSFLSIKWFLTVRPQLHKWWEKLSPFATITNCLTAAAMAVTTAQMGLEMLLRLELLVCFSYLFFLTLLTIIYKWTRHMEQETAITTLKIIVPHNGNVGHHHRTPNFSFSY